MVPNPPSPAVRVGVVPGAAAAAAVAPRPLAAPKRPQLHHPFRSAARQPRPPLLHHLPRHRRQQLVHGRVLHLLSGRHQADRSPRLALPVRHALGMLHRPRQLRPSAQPHALAAGTLGSVGGRGVGVEGEDSVGEGGGPHGVQNLVLSLASIKRKPNITRKYILMSACSHTVALTVVFVKTL